MTGGLGKMGWGKWRRALFSLRAETGSYQQRKHKTNGFLWRKVGSRAATAPCVQENAGRFFQGGVHAGLRTGAGIF